MVGKAKVRIVCIPHTSYCVTANWDPILDKRETNTPMFLMMKSNKEENLTKNERIEKLFGLIVEVTGDRRDNPKIVKHKISKYLHPRMKYANNMKILDWLLHRTFTKRMHTKVIPLAHKLFLFHQLLEASEEIFITHPIKKWRAPPPLEKFKNCTLTNWRKE